MPIEIPSEYTERLYYYKELRSPYSLMANIWSAHKHLWIRLISIQDYIFEWPSPADSIEVIIQSFKFVH